MIFINIIIKIGLILGKWIFVTHSFLTDNDVEKMVIFERKKFQLVFKYFIFQIENINNEIADCNEIYLKFEPFILHVFEGNS